MKSIPDAEDDTARDDHRHDHTTHQSLMQAPLLPVAAIRNPIQQVVRQWKAARYAQNASLSSLQPPSLFEQVAVGLGGLPNVYAHWIQGLDEAICHLERGSGRCSLLQQLLHFRFLLCDARIQPEDGSRTCGWQTAVGGSSAPASPACFPTVKRTTQGYALTVELPVKIAIHGFLPL